MIESGFIPTSTYRLQFHREFNFAHATAILDYLQKLGVSHVYTSPFFQAGAASTHGYDVADHNRINPALGGERAYRIFIEALRARGMGQVLDFVPNHMGISEPINRWWMDVLENGPMSLYEGYFDIEWHPLKPELENKVLLPILGDRYGQVLERREFRPVVENGAFFLRYHEAKLPLNPRTYPQILDRVAAQLGDYAGRDFHDELLSISTALGQLPDQPWQADSARVRNREKEINKRRLARLMETAPEVAAALSRVLEELAGRTGEPASFDALHELLSGQVYRLAYWRVAAEEINYRRFFDINTLAAIRTEVPAVFDASHELVFKMIERGDITGLRIDHIDGLWDPQGYLAKIRERTQGRPLYLLVEKILAADEWLRADWPADGTTGYEFVTDLTHLLLEASAEQKLSRLYATFSEETHLADLIYEKKLLITRMSMASEIATLGMLLNQLSESHRHYRDFTLNQLITAVRETVACFPVYRTYVTPDAPPSDEDRLIVLRSVRQARRRNPSIDKPIFDFLAKVLLLELPVGETGFDRDEQIRFALKFQQCTGPVMAKGLEDTAFYIYNRFVALNEVGGEPGRFGMAGPDFHARCQERLHRTPHGLLATSTHDTKRSEDVRARLAVISEVPDEWQKMIGKAQAANASFKTEIEGRLAPSANEEYLLYQTLAGAWPLEPFTEESRRAFVARIQDYMIKALKEAKINSSWIQPHEEWETATRNFAAAILDPETGRKFLKLMEPFVARIAAAGAINSLTQVVLKCTTPGVPDFYQGSEVWDFSLVDPDNRRPVDYEHRHALLEALDHATVESLLKDWKSGALKLFVTRALMRLRREMAPVFDAGDYRPLDLTGPQAARVIAFLREFEGAQIAVVVPRLTMALGFPPIGRVWKNTMLDLPRGPWRDLFTGRDLQIDDGTPMTKVFETFPLACLVKTDS